MIMGDGAFRPGDYTSDWAALRSEFIDVRGTTVHVVRTGQSSGRTTAPAPHLLVHGLGGAVSNWFEVMMPLASDREVIAVDLPGFGRTVPPHAAAGRVRANARFIPVLLDALGLDQVVLHGNSMGGLLGVFAAHLVPERIDRLVLVAPALPVPRADLLRLSPVALKRFSPFVVPGLGALVLRSFWSRLDVDRILEDVLEVTVADPAGLSPAMLQIMRDNIAFGKEHPWRLEALTAAIGSLVEVLVGTREASAAIAATTTRTLLLWGDRDVLVGRRVIVEAVRRRPDWDVAILEGVGHVPQMEAPGRYVDAVTAWLDDRPVLDLDGIVSLEHAGGPTVA